MCLLTGGYPCHWYCPKFCSMSCPSGYPLDLSHVLSGGICPAQCPVSGKGTPRTGQDRGYPIDREAPPWMSTLRAVTVCGHAGGLSCFVTEFSEFRKCPIAVVFVSVWMIHVMIVCNLIGTITCSLSYWPDISHFHGMFLKFALSYKKPDSKGKLTRQNLWYFPSFKSRNYVQKKRTFSL